MLRVISFNYKSLVSSGIGTGDVADFKQPTSRWIERVLTWIMLRVNRMLFEMGSFSRYRILI
jgi:hypothetical protein